MKRIALLILVFALWPLAAFAGLTRAQLDNLKLAPPPGARVPLDLVFRNLDNHQVTLGEAIGKRPALLLPVDYTCKEICGPALSITAGALAGTGLTAGRDYSLVIVGIDPRDGIDAARTFTAAQVGGPGVSVLTGDKASILALTRAIGYTFVPDDRNDAIAHPAGLVSLTADGRVTRALSSLALEPTDLRLALLEAGEGHIGGIIGQLTLLCYGFDAVHGIYTRNIETVLRIAGVMTVALIAAGIGFLTWRTNRKGAVT
ncbi:MAG TPA: SCO family protein [Xanthobacteraceae bacterium]|jgi:protein SCO1/2|nr:SCO family protein [Xanthobacteraceae bacterium]